MYVLHIYVAFLSVSCNFVCCGSHCLEPPTPYLSLSLCVVVVVGGGGGGGFVVSALCCAVMSN
jgi:hypothetical protein